MRWVHGTSCLLFILLLSCTTIDVDADWDPNAAFSNMHTWAWAPGQSTARGDDPRLESDLVHQRIQSTIENSLIQRGYDKVNDKPDFYVAYHIAIDQKLDARTTYSDYGVGPYGRWGTALPETTIEQYDQGTLLIDVISSDSKKLVWRGRAQSRIQDLKDAASRQARTQEAVSRLLERFPPTEPPAVAGSRTP